MAPDTQHGALVAELAALARGVPQPEPAERLSAAVMTRVSAAPTPLATSRRLRLMGRLTGALASRRRRVVIAVTAILLSLLGTPPVRAAVADWFGFAGVRVRLDPTPVPSLAPPPPTVSSPTALAEARRLVSFEPVVPAALGPPQGVEVSADRRLLSMSWTDKGKGALRLDQFDGRLDYAFAKTARGVEFTAVGGAVALWFDEPHEVVVLDADGTRRTETARLAGHTLIWEYGGTTLRLEGDVTRARAISIANSATALS